MTRAWVVRQETVVARASVLVGNGDLAGFTGGQPVNNAAAPFDPVVFLSLAALGLRQPQVQPAYLQPTHRQTGRGLTPGG